VCLNTTVLLQKLLQRSIEELPLHETAAKQLSCLELWMLWLCRLSDLQDIFFEGEEAASKFSEKVAPYTEAARQLLRILVPCLLQARLFLCINFWLDACLPLALENARTNC
jgi:hypothetical protein